MFRDAMEPDIYGTVSGKEILIHIKALKAWMNEMLYRHVLFNCS